MVDNIATCNYASAKSCVSGDLAVKIGEMALFTAENAAEMQRRGVEAKLSAKEERIVEALSVEVESQNAEKHRKLRLLRVRKQQERVDAMLLVETDPAKLDRLASAAMRLNEQERQLSNRSLPPVIKASPARTKKSTSNSPAPEPE